MPRKKERKSSDKKANGPPDKTVFDEREKELTELQIRRLKEQLDSQKLSCDEVQHQFKDLTQRCVLLEQEKKEALECLVHFQRERDDEVLHLLDRLESLQLKTEQQLDALRLQHAQQIQKLEASVHALTEQNKTLAQVDSLEQFQKQKQKLLSDIRSMQEQLSSQDMKHKDTIHNMAMKALLERKRIKEAMESNMEEEIQRRVELKIPAKVKAAMEENKMLKERLGELSEQTGILQKENSSLRERNGQLRHNMSILKDINRQIISESCTQKKVVEQTRAKCQQLQVKLDESDQQVKHLQHKHDTVHKEFEALRRDHASECEQHLQIRAVVRLQEEQLQEERKKRSMVVETVGSLRHALMEETVQNRADESVNQWRQLILSLMTILEDLDSSSAARNEEPLKADVGVQCHLGHYRSGDLGLVPRPTLKQRRASQRPGPTSSWPQLNPHSYQVSCDELKCQNEEMNEHFRALERRSREGIQSSIEYQQQKEQEIDQLMDQVECLQRDSKKERADLILQHHQEMQDLQNRLDQLTEEHRVVVARLEDLEEFQDQKDMLLSDLKSMKEQLSSREVKHEQAMNHIEIKSQLERKRVEKEMEHRLEARIQDLWDNKVPKRTKLALEENLELKGQFTQLSEKQSVLLKENLALKDRTNRLKRDVDNMENTLSQKSRKSCVQRKVVDHKTSEIVQLQAKLDSCNDKLELLQSKLQQEQEEAETLGWELAMEHEQHLQVRGEVLKLTAELKDEKRRRRNKENIMQEAAASLRDALMNETKGKSVKAVVAEWKLLLMKLMVVLEDSDDSLISTSKTVKEAEKVKSSTKEKDTKETDEEEAKKTDEMEAKMEPEVSTAAEVEMSQAEKSDLSLLYHVSHYRPGDLGIVPRPTAKHKTMNQQPDLEFIRAQLAQNRSVTKETSSSAVGTKGKSKDQSLKQSLNFDLQVQYHLTRHIPAYLKYVPLPTPKKKRLNIKL
ncbi:centromere protein F-like isoform X2 [Synchiropus splendidus]|uniref:centromere protein F-like isoform X2 n=1 Tax=Synchiropus splendidus TaxID=270530 RepID=UPI00237E1BDC|nr:centromere protein F-like isoform X2 [Synchiropus splendidus]